MLAFFKKAIIIMSNSRRVYISSVDNKTFDPQFSTIDINLSGARLERKSNQNLSIALVKASFPSQMGALPITSVKSSDISKNISVLAFSFSTDGVTFGTKQRIYYNQTSSTLNSGANIHNGFWTLNTSINEILTQINTINGVTSDLKVDSLNRLIMSSPTIAIGFYWDDSSVKIMKAFGFTRNLPAGSGESPIITGVENFPDRSPVNVASVLPVIYITTNNNMHTFSSANKGQSVNILASVPVSLNTNTSGNNTIITVIGGLQDIYSQSSQLNYTNHSLEGSHKSIDEKIISNMTLGLVNDELRPIGTLGKEWNLTLDVKIIDDGNF